MLKNCRFNSQIQKMYKSENLDAIFRNILEGAKAYASDVLGMKDDTYVYIVCLLDTKSKI